MAAVPATFHGLSLGTYLISGHITEHLHLTNHEGPVNSPTKTTEVKNLLGCIE